MDIEIKLILPPKLITDVKSGTERLERYLGSMAKPSTKVSPETCRNEARDYIKTNLAATSLNQFLFAFKGTLTQEPLMELVSQTAKLKSDTSVSFLTSTYTNQVNKVYKYYRDLEIEDLLLVAEYNNDIGRGDVAGDDIKAVNNANVKLPVPIPENVVLDTRTSLLWLQPSTKVYKYSEVPQHPDISGGAAWELPTFAQFYKLTGGNLPLSKKGFSKLADNEADSWFYVNQSDYRQEPWSATIISPFPAPVTTKGFYPAFHTWNGVDYKIVEFSDKKYPARPPVPNNPVRTMYVLQVADAQKYYSTT